MADLMNNRSAVNILTVNQMIKNIESSEHYTLRIWEKRFIRRIKSDIARGLGLSTRESIKLHEIYRKSQRFFNECSPTHIFPISTPGEVYR